MLVVCTYLPACLSSPPSPPHHVDVAEYNKALKNLRRCREGRDFSAGLVSLPPNTRARLHFVLPPLGKVWRAFKVHLGGG